MSNEVKEYISVDTKEESWSSDVELVLTNILDNTKQLQLIHKNNYLILRHYLLMIRLPIIVFSSIVLLYFIHRRFNSITSISVISFEKYSRYGNGFRVFYSR